MAKEEQDSIHPKDEDIIQEARDHLRESADFESENRADALAATIFRHGEQWPAELAAKRKQGDRPSLVINKTDAFCIQVANEQRQQRPRIKVHPIGGGATKKRAEVIQGLIRHIEQNKGGGDLAYDTGFDCSITGGWGYWRIMAEYAREDAFEQELYLAPIDNQFSCYGDPNSTLPDGRDQERFLITEVMSKSAFRFKYPDADDGANFVDTGTGDGIYWSTKEDIRVAEYFKLRKRKDILVKLSDGTTVWKKELPPNEVLQQAGISIVDERPSYRRVVCWYKLTALEVIDKKELPGKYIPVIPMYGKVAYINGKRKLSGLVKNAMDPQRNINYWNTAATEAVALAAKPKWLTVAGSTDNYKEEWATANTSATPTLTYDPVDVDGKPAPPPQRIAPEPPPAGMLALVQLADQNLSSVLGIIDPAMRIGGNVSGKALNAEKTQSDNGSYHYFDNMTRSIAFTGVQLLDLIPYYYSEPGRIVRIIGDDGQPSQETLNQPNPDQQAAEQILNDVTVGEYDVVMDTGPGYQSKRMEAVDSMMPLFEKNEEVFKVAGDLLFRNMDFPGSEVIADRLAAANPLAQIDDKSPIPPGVQMKLKAQEAQIQQLQKQLQQAAMEIKFRGGIEQMKQEGETRRTLMETSAKVHANEQDNTQWGQDIAARTATARHDTEVRSITAVNVAEINQMGNLLKTRVDNAHDLIKLEKEAGVSESEVTSKSNQNEQ